MASNQGFLVKQITSQIDLIIDNWVKKYGETTGRKPDRKAILFVKAMLMTTVDFIGQAVYQPEKINLKTIGMLVVQRALATAGFTMNDNSASECVVSTMALAIATTDYFEIMVTSAALSATGEGAVVGVPVMLAATLYFASQASSWANTCAATYVSEQEARIPLRYHFSTNSALIRHRAMTLDPMTFVA